MSNIKEEIYEVALTESQMECDALNTLLKERNTQIDELKALLKERETECINAKDCMVKQAGTINELSAHVELLRKALYFIAEDYSTDNTKYLHPYSVAEAVLEQTPAQSLNHIKAQVEEETICNVDVADYLKTLIEARKMRSQCDSWSINEVFDELFSLINKYRIDIPRKYKEPSDEEQKKN